jgi:hypothetical protein
VYWNSLLADYFVLEYPFCTYFSTQPPGGFYRHGRGGTSKLDAAKTCIQAIAKQLRPSDDVSILLFNHSQEVLLPMTSLGGYAPSFLYICIYIYIYIYI